MSTCRECRFFVVLREEDGKPVYGDCYRYPPTLHREPKWHDEFQNLESARPQVGPESFCGEFTAQVRGAGK